MDFRWIEWNIEKVEGHGVAPEEAESAVRASNAPYPRRGHDERWFVWGQSEQGRFLQVVFLEDEDGTYFVIHARPLDNAEKRRFRRQQR